MKKYYLLKVLLLLFAFDIIVGCASSTIRPASKHWHGKNVHRIEEASVTSSPPAGTVRHWHGKNVHRVETTQ